MVFMRRMEGMMPATLFFSSSIISVYMMRSYRCQGQGGQGLQQHQAYPNAFVFANEYGRRRCQDELAIVQRVPLKGKAYHYVA